MNCTHNAHHEPKSSSLLIVGIVYHDGVIFSKKKKLDSIHLKFKEQFAAALGKNKIQETCQKVAK